MTYISFPSINKHRDKIITFNFEGLLFYYFLQSSYITSLFVKNNLYIFAELLLVDSNYLLYLIGADCIKFWITDDHLICEYNYADQTPSKLINNSCVAFNEFKSQISHNYILTTNFGNCNRGKCMFITLKG